MVEYGGCPEKMCQQELSCREREIPTSRAKIPVPFPLTRAPMPYSPPPSPRTDIHSTREIKCNKGEPKKRFTSLKTLGGMTKKHLGEFSHKTTGLRPRVEEWG